MGEKIYVINSSMGLEQYQVAEINEKLTRGWSVKSVTMSSDKEYTSAIIVLRIGD